MKYSAKIQRVEGRGLVATILRDGRRFAGMLEQSFGNDSQMAEAWARTTLVDQFKMSPELVEIENLESRR